MERDPFPGWPYLTQGQLGVLFGVSSHTVGHWLAALGLKGMSGPTAYAWNNGYCTLVHQDYRRFPSWHKEKVVQLFEEDGHERVDLAPATPAAAPSDTITLVGPFTVEPTGEDGYAIVGSGVTAIWARGRANSDRLAAILNIADRCGKLAHGVEQEAGTIS